MEPGTGGSVLWAWEGLHTWPQTIEIWEPGVRLKTRYDSTVSDGRGGTVPLFVDFRIEGAQGGTTLRLVHSGFGADADFDQEFDGIRHGWAVELKSLRLYLERHLGKDRHLAWSTVDLALPLEEAWALLTGPDGMACGPEVQALPEGAPFRMRTGRRRRVRGNRSDLSPKGVLRNRPTAHGDSFLRVTVEDCGGRNQAVALARDLRAPRARDPRAGRALGRAPRTPLHAGRRAGRFGSTRNEPPRRRDRGSRPGARSSSTLPVSSSWRTSRSLPPPPRSPAGSDCRGNG